MGLSSIKQNILAVLTDGPFGALDVVKGLKEMPLSWWTRYWVSQGNVYVNLRTLEWGGYVESYLGTTLISPYYPKPRRMFRLTHKGWTHLGYERATPANVHSVVGPTIPRPVHYWSAHPAGISCGEPYERENRTSEVTTVPDKVTCAGCRYRLFEQIIRKNPQSLQRN